MGPKKVKNMDIEVKRWSNDDTLKLIGLYQDMEFLWNTKHDEFHKKPKRDATIMEFVQKFENRFTNDEIKSKWHNLRNYFSGELKKEKKGKKTGSGKIHAYTSTWEFYSSMEFLRDTLLPAESKSSLMDDSAKTTDQDSRVDEEQEMFDDDDESQKTDDTPAESTSARSTPTFPFVPRKRVKNEDTVLRNEFFKEAIIALKGTIQPQESNIESPNQAFGKNVVSSLDALPLYNQGWAKSEIQNILFRAAYIQGPNVPTFGTNFQTNQQNYSFPYQCSSSSFNTSQQQQSQESTDGRSLTTLGNMSYNEKM